MADKKIIAVVGATGAQGGGLVRSILADREGAFAARAITRDPTSAAARALADAGAEVVAADLDDVESLKRAFDGAYGAYCVTFFWAHFSVDREQAEARRMAEAAKAARLSHVIWSTLEDTRLHVPLDDGRMPTLQGNYKVPHFDGKGEADHYFTEAGVPTTFLLPSFYWENFIHFGAGPKKGPDGTYLLTFPLGTAAMAGIAAEDIGGCAHGIFKEGTSLVGERIGVAGEHLTGEQMAAALGTRPRSAGALQRRLGGHLPQLRLSGRRRTRQHVPVLPRLRGRLQHHPQRRPVAAAESLAAVVRHVAGGPRGADPTGLTAAAGSAGRLARHALLNTTNASTTMRSSSTANRILSQL